MIACTIRQSDPRAASRWLIDVAGLGVGFTVETSFATAPEAVADARRRFAPLVPGAVVESRVLGDRAGLEIRVRVPLVNPRASSSYSTAAGVMKYFTDWDVPPSICRALGAGCATGICRTLDPDFTPYAVCLPDPTASGTWVADRFVLQPEVL